MKTEKLMGALPLPDHRVELFDQGFDRRALKCSELLRPQRDSKARPRERPAASRNDPQPSGGAVGDGSLRNVADQGNRLEALRGDLKGFQSVRVNDQRVIFRWTSDGPEAVDIVDYH